MHLVIFLALGPLIGLATAVYLLPPLYDYLIGGGVAMRSSSFTLKMSLPPMPLAYVLGFFPALSASRVDHILHDMQTAAPLRACVTGVAAMLAFIFAALGVTMFFPFLTAIAAATLLGSYKAFLLAGVVGFLPGVLCSLAGGFFHVPR